LDRRGADAQSEPLTRELRAYGRRQPGCRALMAHYGIGALTAVTILAELGDARRFSSSRLAVRYAGLRTSSSTNPISAARPGISPAKGRRRCAGRSTRRHSSRAARAPDHADYEQAAARLGGNRACLAVARKLLKRSYYTLGELGDEALAPAA
jgi:transposase